MIRTLAFLSLLQLFLPQIEAQIRSKTKVSAEDHPEYFADSIQGIVFDRITTLPLIGAQVSVDGNRAVKDALTDENGIFSLEFAQPVRLGASMDLYIQKNGYKPRTQPIGASPRGILAEISLTPKNPATRLRDTGGAQKGNSIFINYLRLFGAFQVPLLLANQYLGPGMESNDSSDSFEKYEKQNRVDERSPDEAKYRRNHTNIETQVIAFWRNWEYKDAVPIRSRAWGELFQKTDYDTPTQLLKAVSANDERMLQSFLFAGVQCGETGAGPEHRECPGKYSEAEVAAATKENAAKVGFLSLIIENTSSSNLLDVRLHFREFKKTDRILDKSEQVALVEKTIATQPEQTLVVPRIKAHGSFLWLLSIYLKDEKGYPESYLSSVDLPTRITYRSADSELPQQLTVRRPLMDKAAKVVVPWGWYMQ